MSTPNFIPGMRMKGIGRRSKKSFYKKLDRSWLESQAKKKKDQREQELANKRNQSFME